MQTEYSHSIDHLSQTYKACGDPLRAKIIRVTKQDAFGVLELARLFDVKQSSMSHHLKILTQASLIEAQREGNAIFYRRPLTFHSKAVQSLTESIYHAIDIYELEESLIEGIEKIRQQRSNQSQAFFAKNYDQISEQQELIASHDVYASASIKLLKESLTQLTNSSSSQPSAMEVGPGDGFLLEELTQIFSKVIALDNSSEMLKKAKQTISRSKKNADALSSIEFLLGDTTHFCKLINEGKASRVDAVIMNMVLHHVPAPAKIFVDIHSSLNDGGSLVICDLSKHSQEWARENCGDLWCGFDSQELDGWATSAGLQPDKEVFIGLRNGFQILLRSFIKPLPATNDRTQTIN